MELGQKVTFTRTLNRRSRYDWNAHQTVKRWETFAYEGEPEPEPREGILIGVRTLSNGHVIYHGFEDGSEYVGVHFFKAYLIAFDLRRAPVFALPEHIVT